MSHALFNLASFVVIAATGFGYANGSVAPENAFFITYAMITLLVGRFFLARSNLSFLDAVKSITNIPRTASQGVTAASYALPLISGLLIAGTIAGA